VSENNKRSSVARTSVFGNKLLASRTLRSFAGGISQSHFQALWPDSNSSLGLTAFESQLAVLLFRMHLVPTVFIAKQLIRAGWVTVNGKTCRRHRYKVRPGSFVILDPKIIPLVRGLQSVWFSKQRLRQPIPRYVVVHFGLLGGVLTEEPSITNVHYTFKPNLEAFC